MFTGIINGFGEIQQISPFGHETRLLIRPLFSLRDATKGESIAVNGACLTVELFHETVTRECLSFQVYASAETMKRTTLGKLKTGSKVNLERALALGDRLGGHLVTGHIDCIATVANISQAGESKKIKLRFDNAYSRQIVPKGSVTLDGVSLTVNDCAPGTLTVNVIPETQQATTIGTWRPGMEINLETDIIGKYVQHLTEPYAQPVRQEITFDFLKRNGF